jgi:hypothetical protein
MSEYIEFEVEMMDDPAFVTITTNLTLAEDEAEYYFSLAEMAEGSAVAQIIAYVEGIQQLKIERNRLTVWREPDAPWHHIVTDITAAVKEYFL